MITKKEVEHVSRLARIELKEEEKEKLTEDLARILEHNQILQKVDTSGVELDLHDTHPVNQTREDKSSDSEIQEDILSQAPKRKGKYFEVREVLE